MECSVEEYYKQKFWRFFDEQDIHAIRAVIDEGYSLTEILYSAKGAEFLKNTAIGTKDVRPHLLRAAIAYSAKFFQQKGALAFETRIRNNTSKNSRHIELIRHGTRVYIARVLYPGSLPIEADYRTSSTNFNDNLFDPKPIEDKDDKDIVYIATYGDGGKDKFCYGNLGIMGRKSWFYSEPLTPGIYRYVTKNEEEQLINDVTESFQKQLEKDDDNHGKEGV